MPDTTQQQNEFIPRFTVAARDMKTGKVRVFDFYGDLYDSGAAKNGLMVNEVTDDVNFFKPISN